VKRNHQQPAARYINVNSSPPELAATPRSGPQSYRQRLFREHACDELPLTLRHQRIYILPSSRGLAFMAVVALTLMASINYQLNLGYALAFTLTGLFGACLFNAYRNLSGIQLQSIGTQECFAPSPLRFDLRLSEIDNRERYSIELSVKNQENICSVNQPIDIAANRSVPTTLEIPGSQRGIHHLGRLKISSQFPMGLWNAWGYLHAPASGLVFPSAENDAPQPASSDPAHNDNSHSASTAQQQASSPSGDEFDSLRKWRVGEPLASVAWKTVARGRGWHSKQFVSQHEHSTTVIRWDSLPASIPVETRIRRLCSWVLRAENEHAAYRVELPGFAETGASASRFRNRVLRHLALLPDNDNPGGFTS